MDQLKSIYAQGRDLFNGMTPGSRILSVLLFAVLLVAFGYLVVGSTSDSDATPGGGKYIYLYGGQIFSSTEQRAIEAAFGAKNLNEFEFVAGKIRVPKTKRADYIAAIVNAEAIREPGSLLSELIYNAGPLDSEANRRSKQFHGMYKYLEEILRRIDGIEEVSVLAGEQRNRTPGSIYQMNVRSAAVTVWPISNQRLSNKTISLITRTTAAGLGIDDYKKISIADGRTGTAYLATDEYVEGGQPRTMLGAQIMRQEFWENTIHKALSYIDGVRVTAAVEVTQIASAIGEEVRHLKPSSPVHTREAETSFDKSVENRRGRPGMVAQNNQPLNLDMAGGYGGRETQKEKTSQAESTMALQGDEYRITKEPFAPKSVNATITIPSSYVKKIWNTENPPAEGAAAEEPTPDQLRQTEARLTTRVKDQVANLLKMHRDPTNPDITEAVFVSVVPDAPFVPAPPPTAAERVSEWIGANWQTLSLLGLVAAGLFVLWAITRPAKPEPIVIYEAPEIPAEELERRYAPSTPEEEEELERQRSLASFDKSMRSLQEEVTDLVEENPDAAAAILRQWIGNVVTVEH